MLQGAPIYAGAGSRCDEIIGRLPRNRFNSMLIE